ncbi:MAG TPA: hypothetical protein VF041_11345 [Gemmatimonadaceae bacterium]
MPKRLTIRSFSAYEGDPGEKFLIRTTRATVQLQPREGVTRAEIEIYRTETSPHVGVIVNIGTGCRRLNAYNGVEHFAFDCLPDELEISASALVAAVERARYDGTIQPPKAARTADNRSPA